MKKRYVVKLMSDEWDQLEDIINRGCEAVYRRRHAQVLMLVDEGEHGPGLFDKDAAERARSTRGLQGRDPIVETITRNVLDRMSK